MDTVTHQPVNDAVAAAFWLAAAWSVTAIVTALVGNPRVRRVTILAGRPVCLLAGTIIVWAALANLRQAVVVGVAMLAILAPVLWLRDYLGWSAMVWAVLTLVGIAAFGVTGVALLYPIALGTIALAGAQGLALSSQEDGIDSHG